MEQKNNNDNIDIIITIILYNKYSNPGVEKMIQKCDQ